MNLVITNFLILLRDSYIVVFSYAIHVSFNASQWWYQPQALLTERSGLIESPSAWFLHKALRAHGHDQTTLQPLWGKPLSTSSWEVGDVVVPLTLSQKSDMDDTQVLSEDRDCFGRVAAEAQDPSSSIRSRGRRPDTVLVEFMDPEFGRRTGVINALEDVSDNVVQVRRVPVDKLQHGRFCEFGVFKNGFDAINSGLSGADNETDVEPSSGATVVINSSLRAEIEGVSCLDPISIQSVAKTCEKQPALCSSALASGLCDAILSAVSLAEQSAKKGKVNDRMGVAVSSLGLLSFILCRNLLSVDGEERSAAEDINERTQEGEDVNLSAVLAEASLSLYDGSAIISEGRRSSDASRTAHLDTLAARRLNPGSAVRARGPLFRARARHTNSTSSRSSRDEWNIDGNSRADTRVAICSGLLRNSLMWLKASLQPTQDSSKTKAASDSLPSSMTNARDEDGMSLLLLAITFGCSKDIVHHLILSEANISKAEIKAAAVSNQPHLLSVLLQHSVCPKQVIESLHVTAEIDAVFRDAEARQKIQEQALRHKTEEFVSTLLVSLCSLAKACRTLPARIQRLGRAASEALVGNVLLRALHENQQKALAAASPRRRKHGSSAQVLSDADSERLSLSLSSPWGAADSEVFASASAMSPCHGVLLGLPGNFFSGGFLDGTPTTRNERMSALLSFVESLLWSNEKNSMAAGLTILHVFLKSIPLNELSCEIERYGLRDLMSAHELIAGRHLAGIKSRLKNTKALETDTEITADESRANKKRPRPHIAANTPSAGDGVVLCPKLHVAELHLTKHSSFRCDLCGKGVLRDRPMHGCRECDWDACETCTDQAEGGIVKWGHILELSVNCRKLLEGMHGVQLPSDGVADMIIDQSFDVMSKGSACLDFSSLARKLRLRDKSALSDLASNMEASDRMTNHEFVTFILPALHAALVDTHGVNGDDQFGFKALEALTNLVESLASVESHGDDDSHMSVEDITNQADNTGMVDSYGQAPIELANRVPSFALRRMQDILSFSENMSVLHVIWDEKENGAPMSVNGTRLKSLTKPVELKISLWRPPHVASSPRAQGDMTVFAEPLLPSKELERHVIRSGRIEDETYLSYCRR